MPSLPSIGLKAFCTQSRRLISTSSGVTKRSTRHGEARWKRMQHARIRSFRTDECTAPPAAPPLLHHQGPLQVKSINGARQLSRVEHASSSSGVFAQALSPMSLLQALSPTMRKPVGGIKMTATLGGGGAESALSTQVEELSV
mmetsp:Transcript_67635/g.134197  ORF Transcript_67635/g.134197 Transcript_67635/m.134197 type:complete len:143 (+) Transcript_67635:514-942(+)